MADFTGDVLVFAKLLGCSCDDSRLDALLVQKHIHDRPMTVDFQAFVGRSGFGQPREQRRGLFRELDLGGAELGHDAIFGQARWLRCRLGGRLYGRGLGRRHGRRCGIRLFYLPLLWWMEGMRSPTGLRRQRQAGSVKDGV